MSASKYALQDRLSMYFRLQCGSSSARFFVFWNASFSSALMACRSIRSARMLVTSLMFIPKSSLRLKVALTS